MKTYSRIEKLQAAVMLVQSELKKPLVVADIGTDHGYLADLLSKNEQVEKIIATDISAKSLSKLEAKINYKKLSKIETAVGDGLIPVKSADVSVIAGVGGHEIVKILESQNIGDDGNRKCDYFVLQPAQNVNELRIWLFDNKIRILKDYIIFEADRFYPIIIVQSSKKQRNRKSIYNIWLGRDNDVSNNDFVLFLKDLKSNLEFLKTIDKKRAKKDKLLYQKYKLNRLIDKLLNV